MKLASLKTFCNTKSKTELVSRYTYMRKENEIYQQTWFGNSEENGFGSIYNNINNK